MRDCKIPVLIKIVEIAGYLFTINKSKKNNEFVTQIFNDLVFTSKDYQPRNVDDLKAFTYFGMLDLKHAEVDYPSPFADALKLWGIRTKFGVTSQIELAALPVIAKDNAITADTYVMLRKKQYLYQMTPTKDEFEAAISSIVEELPDKLASFVRSEAWERGHSSGYEEVLNIARDLASKLS